MYLFTVCTYNLWLECCNLYFFQDYELQLVAYKAHVEPLTSPLKKTKMESASDNVIQEVRKCSQIII